MNYKRQLKELFTTTDYKTDLNSFMLSYDFSKMQNNLHLYAKDFRAYGHGFSMMVFCREVSESVNVEFRLLNNEHYEDPLCVNSATISFLQIKLATTIRPLLWKLLMNFEDMCRVEILKKVFGKDYLKPFFARYHGYTFELRNHPLENTFKRNKNVTNLILAEKYRTVCQTDYRIVVYHGMFRLCSVCIFDSNKKVVSQIKNIPYDILCELLREIEEYLFFHTFADVDFSKLSKTSAFITDLMKYTKDTSKIYRLPDFNVNVTKLDCINSIKTKRKSL